MTKNTNTETEKSIEQQMLDEMRLMNERLTLQITLMEQADWKLWILSNSVIDSLLEQGLLTVDPRKK